LPTKTPTNISCLGILLIILKLIHSNVPIATIIITPTKAAMVEFTIGAPNKIITRIAKAATIPDRRALEPAEG
jgi:hypothetical protein